MAELIKDFILKDFPPQAMVVGRGLLPIKGKLFIGGNPKIGKSFIIMNMALDLAAGRPLFSARYDKSKPVFPVYRPNRVLLIENEIGEHKLQERFKAIIGDTTLETLSLFVKSRDMALRLDSKEGQEKLAAEIEACKPDVLILDPLAQFHLQDENSAQMMGAVMRVGDEWIEKYALSLIYVHHTGHSNPQNPRRGGDKLRGSTAIFASADSVMLIDKQNASSEKAPILRFTFDLRHGEPLEPMFFRKETDGRLTWCGEGLAASSLAVFANPSNKVSFID